MRCADLRTTALLTGTSETQLHTWRHHHPQLQQLGERVKKAIWFTLPEIGLMALVALLSRQGRDLHDAVAAAADWQEALDHAFTSDEPGECFAVELTFSNDGRERLYAVGAAELAQVASTATRASCVSILNLSALALEIQIGWTITQLGLEDAREDLERGLDPEDREAALALFARIAARVAPPAPSAGQITPNGTLALDAVPVRVPLAPVVPARVRA